MPLSRGKASVTGLSKTEEGEGQQAARTTAASRRKMQRDSSQLSIDSEPGRASTEPPTSKASKRTAKDKDSDKASRPPSAVRAKDEAVGSSGVAHCAVPKSSLTKEISKELGPLLLQELPDAERLGVDDNTDFVEGLCVFLNPGANMFSKEFCLACGSSSDRADFHFCRDCGDCFHASCFDPVLKIAPEKRAMWRCPACRICEICTGEDNWEQMLVCDECDRGFHTYCLKPPLKSIPDGGWRCNECVQCLSCGSKSPGPRASDRWQRDFRLCQACWALFQVGNYCPICTKVYKDSDDALEMVQCDCCEKWVHISCGAIDNVTYSKLKNEDDFSWECPKCKGDVDLDSDDEIQEKFPLPKAKSIIDNHIRLEDYCSSRLRVILNEIRSLEASNDASTEVSQGVEAESASKVRKADGKGAGEGGGSQASGVGCSIESALPNFEHTGNEEVRFHICSVFQHLVLES